MTKKAKTLMSCLLVALCAGSASAGERRISVEEYRDKMKAGWLGQMIGVGWGLPTEFKYRWKIIPEDKTPAWKPEMINMFVNDDLYVEMSFIKTLETYGVDVSPRQAGIDYANSQFGVVHANYYGRDALRRGIAPPDSGHPQFNRSGVDHIHSDDIDYQIEADYSGLIAPGMPNVSIELGEKFGVLMNYGDGVYAGQFMGAMIAGAFFETDMEKLVVAGLKAIPEGSQYHECISDVLKWYKANPDDWQKTWQVLEDKYGEDACKNDAVRCDVPGIDVKINGAYAVMGLLYGKGDIAETCKIAMRCGLDSDCNPSSAVGILATSLGTAGISKEYTTALDREARFATTEYTFDKLLNVCEKLAREFVVDQGGRIEKDASGKEWFVISAKKPVPSKLVQSYDPEPPTGNRFTKEEMAQMAYFSLGPAFDKKFPGNPYKMNTRSCGTKGDPGFREAYNGRTNVIASTSVEGSRSFAFNMVKGVDPKKKYKMILEVGHDKGHSWTLIVVYPHKGVHKRLLTTTINDKTATDGWKTFEIDLPQGTWAIPLQITSWYDLKDKCTAYWSKIEIVEVEE